jgi:tetratricopeptide (TPR) repeat protein
MIAAYRQGDLRAKGEVTLRQRNRFIVGRFSKLETRPAAPPTSAPPAQNGAPRPGPDAESRPVGEADTPQYNLEHCLHQGDEAFFRGDTKESLRWYSRAMKVENGRLEPWVAQIRLLLLTRQLNEAKVWLTRALSLFPESPALISLHALHNALSGHLRQAMGASDRLLGEQSGSGASWLARGHILILADQHKNADFCFDQCMQLSGEHDWKTPMMIGLVLDAERHWAKSIRYYEAALERRAALPYAWYRIGLARARVGQREAARQAFLRAEALCGDDDSLRRKVEAAETGSVFHRLGALFRRRS